MLIFTPPPTSGVHITRGSSPNSNHRGSDHMVAATSFIYTHPLIMTIRMSVHTPYTLLSQPCRADSSPSLGEQLDGSVSLSNSSPGLGEQLDGNVSQSNSSPKLGEPLDGSVSQSNSSPKLGEGDRSLLRWRSVSGRDKFGILRIHTPSPLRGTPPSLGGELRLEWKYLAINQ